MVRQRFNFEAGQIRILEANNLGLHSLCIF